MDIDLAKGENVVKTWEVANIKSEKEKIEHKVVLSVTDKRLIIKREDEKVIGRNEVLLKDVKGVSVSRYKENNEKKIVALIFGILFLVLGIIFVASPAEGVARRNTYFIGLTAIMIGLIVILCSCLRSSPKFAFRLSIYTNTLSCNLINVSVGLNGFSKNDDKKGSELSTTTVVNETVINDIIETIGKLIVENNK